jgi:hypothetical protein
VGLHLQDRYEISVISRVQGEFSTLKEISFEPGDPDDPAREEWLKLGTGLYTTNGGTVAILNRSGVDEEREPDLFIFGAPASFRGYYWGWSKDLLHRKSGDTGAQRNLWSWVILKAYTGTATAVFGLVKSNDPARRAGLDQRPIPGESKQQALARVYYNTLLLEKWHFGALPQKGRDENQLRSQAAELADATSRTTTEPDRKPRTLYDQ